MNKKTITELLMFLDTEIKESSEEYWYDVMSNLKKLVLEVDKRNEIVYTLKVDDYGLQKWKEVTKDLGVDFFSKEIELDIKRVEGK